MFKIRLNFWLSTNKGKQMTKVQSQYENANCPDCGTPIPIDVENEDTCINCNFVFCEICPECEAPIQFFMKDNGNTLVEVFGCPRCDS